MLNCLFCWVLNSTDTVLGYIASFLAFICELRPQTSYALFTRVEAPTLRKLACLSRVCNAMSLAGL